MKKVLFVAHVDSHIRHFHLPYLKYFKEQGYEVHVATANDENEEFPNCDCKHTISFERSPLKFNNIKAIRQMKQLLKEEKFDIIHCHTPMGGVITRIAAKKTRKNGTTVLYTAHGFHFYHGSPILNWMIYYPVEKYLSKYTDGLITINHEDYKIAKEKFHAQKVYMVHGVGVDEKKFNNEVLDDLIKKKYYHELNTNENDFIMMYVAELNENKNQILLINAMHEIKKECLNIKLFLIGKGLLHDFYESKIKEYHLENNVFLLGYRNDVSDLLKIANLYVASSQREGLPINIVEACLSGLPVLAKKSRGHTEVVKDNVNGFLFESRDELIQKIKVLLNDEKHLQTLARNARSSVMDFSMQNAFQEQIKIYEELLPS